MSLDSRAGLYCTTSDFLNMNLLYQRTIRNELVDVFLLLANKFKYGLSVFHKLLVETESK